MAFITSRMPLCIGLLTAPMMPNVARKALHFEKSCLSFTYLDRLTLLGRHVSYLNS